MSTEDVSLLKDEGLKILEDLTEKTIKTSEASDLVGKTILETSKSTQNKIEASTMIKNIAEQTNLLALNAAIEALEQEKQEEVLQSLQMKLERLQNNQIFLQGK